MVATSIGESFREVRQENVQSITHVSNLGYLIDQLLGRQRLNIGDPRMVEDRTEFTHSSTFR